MNIWLVFAMVCENSIKVVKYAFTFATYTDRFFHPELKRNFSHSLKPVIKLINMYLISKSQHADKNEPLLEIHPAGITGASCSHNLNGKKQ